MKRFFFLFWIPALFAQAEVSDTFIVTILDDSIKVVAPPKMPKRLSIILENKSLSVITGKVISRNKKFVHYLSLRPQTTETVAVSKVYDDQFIFYPMAPSFQSVKLIAGKRSYEIPAQEKP